MILEVQWRTFFFESILRCREPKFLMDIPISLEQWRCLEDLPIAGGA